MTRDEARAKCIAAMAEAMFDCCYRGYNAETQKMLWGREAGDLKRKATAAFDALHGLAFVNPIESTSEMRLAGGTAQQKSMQEYGDPEVVWNAMAAASDLTTPPEAKL